MSQLKAPNGNPSNLTLEQWRMVRTPQFKAWFGDWENEPENASKVVDENGEPMVVYHGSPKGDTNVFTMGSDEVVSSGLKEFGLYDKVWQAGTILLPVKSVGVMGDERTYEFTVALRAVTSVDGMTADWAHLPYEFLAHMSNSIINQVRGINRVVYDISSKPPVTIEWE